MRRTGTIGISLLFTVCLLLASPFTAAAQDSAPPAKHGRKYKPPPQTSRIEVLVTKKSTGKPIPNAAVVFNPSKDGKDLGSLEVKTDPEGKAIVDVIPTGSLVRVQIIATGYATYGGDYQVDEASREIPVQMESPHKQISTYAENHGKDADRKAGVQDDPETVQRHHDTAPASGSAPSTPSTPADGSKSAPANSNPPAEKQQ